MTAAEPGTLVEVLRTRVAAQGPARAFTWLGASAAADRHLTFAALGDHTGAIALRLRALGPPGERALLLCPPGFDFIAALLGCLAAGWVAVPAYPPPLNQRLDRVRTIAADADPTVALTTRPIFDRLRDRLPDEPDLASLAWLTVDDLPAAGAAAPGRPPAPDQPAVLQYTSGSMATPRGIVLTHANLVHNTRQIARRFGAHPGSRGVIWLPPYHDMGLIGGLLEGLWVGFPTALLSPAAFLQRPRRWLEAITRTGGTISGGPNFAYDLCVDRIPPAERGGLDLSTWAVAFNGAEPVRAATLDRFATAFGPVGFRPRAWYPCYGLAEATLMVTGGRADAPPVRRGPAVGSGTSLDDQELRIVDPDAGSPVPAGETGEIWVRGPSVAAGIWRQPALTAATFGARTSGGAGPFLRTGDLGYLDAAGELFVTGRLKALLIVGGRKIPAEDVEATVQAAGGGPCVALTTELGGPAQVVVVAEAPSRQSTASADHAALAAAVRARVATDHQLPVAAVAITRPRGIPRTSSGKLQRTRCREAFEHDELPTLYLWRAPWTAAARASC
jgi:acyl-CoA synthetase (AMP-forming)/AMP-acid ligase II